MSLIPPHKRNVHYSPHVVILGAGASLAAFPNGDLNGRKLPLMNSLADAAGIVDILPFDYIPFINNFEKLYGKISKENSTSELKSVIENKVYQYFYEMEIPETPTLYDYLILSLRKKDAIATFNWDPLLLKCLRRHSQIKQLPKVFFLHGNVAVGICKACKINGYSYNKICHRCNKPFEPMKLLYPVGKKDYSSDNSIAGEWEALKWHLQHAFFITVFGYSAPSTDVDPKKLMLDALILNRSREFSELEIIDVKSRKKVEKNWYNFFYEGHYRIVDKLQRSYIWHHPRRSCDAFASAYLMNTPWSTNSYPEFESVAAMHDWVLPLIEDEERVESADCGFTYKAK